MKLLEKTITIFIFAFFIFGFFTSCKDEKKPNKTNTKPKSDTTAQTKALDTLHTKMINPDEYEEGEEYQYVNESYIIGNEAFLRNAPVADESSKVKTLKFGDKVYMFNGESQNGFARVYLKKPNENSPRGLISLPMYYMSSSVLVSESEFYEYKSYFSLPPFSEIPSKVKRLILSKNYQDGIQYYLTQNADRAKTTFATGDYDGDGVKDIAVIMDNNEKQSTKLLIICTNKATKEPYMAYSEVYSDKVRIKTIKKGTSFKQAFETEIDNSYRFQELPSDGIILSGEGVNLVIFYEKELQKYLTYDFAG